MHRLSIEGENSIVEARLHISVRCLLLNVLTVFSQARVRAITNYIN